MKQVSAMVGNSSSGIIEAATFGLPVVNIGIRQQGRVRGENVIDTGNTQAEILAGIERALSAEFRTVAQKVSNPYGDGNAVEAIMAKLREVELNSALTIKPFNDLN
jgi:UDP-N-acetylglucosamine 2-epimerase